MSVLHIEYYLQWNLAVCMAYFTFEVYLKSSGSARNLSSERVTILKINGVWYKSNAILLGEEEIEKWGVRKPTFQAQKAICERCGIEWAPRTKEKPIHCPNPKCRSAYWDRPRKQTSRKGK